MHPTIPEEQPDVDRLDATLSPARKGSLSKSQRVYLDIPSAKYVEIEQAVNPVRLKLQHDSGAVPVMKSPMDRSLIRGSLVGSCSWGAMVHRPPSVMTHRTAPRPVPTLPCGPPSLPHACDPLGAL